MVFFGEGKELKVTSTNGIRKCVPCECGGKEWFARLANDMEVDMDVTLISPQGMLQLAKGETGIHVKEMAPYHSISMKLTVRTYGYEDSSPLAIELRQSAESIIDSDSHLFRLASMQVRTDGGVNFGYMKDIHDMECKKKRQMHADMECILQPKVRGPSAYFISPLTSSEEEVTELLKYVVKLDDITKGMCYWSRRAKIHANKIGYKQMIMINSIRRMQVSFKDEFSHREIGDDLDYWIGFAPRVKLLVDQIIESRNWSVGLLQRESEVKLVEERQRKEFVELQEAKLQLMMQDSAMQNKHTATVALKEVYGKVHELRKHAV